jgi:F-type H+-transporting ATPase subunit alpha
MKQTAGVISLIEKALTPNAQTAIEEIGTVIGVGDGICKVYGLTNVIYGELVLFESGARGIVMDLDEDYVSIILLDHAADVFEQEVVRRTGHLFQVPVGDSLLGRVLNPSGDPIDAYTGMPAS